VKHCQSLVQSARVRREERNCDQASLQTGDEGEDKVQRGRVNEKNSISRFEIRAEEELVRICYVMRGE
jgi:hypothetical protein